MVTPHQLQNSNVFGRVNAKAQSRAALAELRRDPQTFLTNHRVTTGVIGGYATTLQQAGFQSLPNGDVRLGNLAVGPSAITVPALVTPTRANAGPGMANRLAAVQRFARGHGNAQLWLTDQQTGCTVLILDWGNSYSMVHVLPYQRGSYNKLMRGMFSLSGGFQSNRQNHYLRDDVNRITRTTMGHGAAPQRYILVQSQSSLDHRQTLQLVGVAALGGWRFYVQRCQAGHAINVVGVHRLPWRSWRSDWTWHSATS